MWEYLANLRERFNELDRLLRGELTRPEALDGQTLHVSARRLAVVALILAMFYGACMGSFSLLKEIPPDLSDPGGRAMQLVASTVKTPALFFLTLLVTLPSLYVANALIGSRLTLLGMTRLLVASLAVNVAVLSSLGTIVLFFSVTTESYPFLVLLSVAAFTVAGVLGLMFLLQTLHRVTTTDAASPTEANASDDEKVQSYLSSGSADDPADSDSETPSALDMPPGQVLGEHTRLVFKCWIVLFSLVGAQMGWVLRPFIGSPDLAFTFFRERESNIFAAVLGALRALFFGGG